MLLKTPKFWFRDHNAPPSFIEYVLSPLSMLYHYTHKAKFKSVTTYKSNIPVICVGNITIGGSGKTPAIIAINNIIISNNIAISPVFITRGYGGSEKGPKVITDHLGADEAGDEPLLLSIYSKTIISVDRPDGAKLAHDIGSDLILMDDGFQNPSLYKDISFIVIDGKTGFGNGKLIPSGPLREPIKDALSRAQAVIFIGDDIRNIKPKIPPHITIFTAKIKSNYTGNKNDPLIAFAGLAHPQKFKSSLENDGLNLLEFHSYPDHYPYNGKELDALIISAKKQNATLITTEKDYVRIPQKYRDNIRTFPIELVWDNNRAITSFLKDQFLSITKSKYD